MQVIVTQQPQYHVIGHQIQPGIKPNNYLVLSIVNMLLCFFILGLIALIFSLQVLYLYTMILNVIL